MESETKRRIYSSVCAGSSSSNQESGLAEPAYKVENNVKPSNNGVGKLTSDGVQERAKYYGQFDSLSLGVSKQEWSGMSWHQKLKFRFHESERRRNIAEKEIWNVKARNCYLELENIRAMEEARIWKEEAKRLRDDIEKFKSQDADRLLITAVRVVAGLLDTDVENTDFRSTLPEEKHISRNTARSCEWLLN